MKHEVDQQHPKGMIPHLKNFHGLRQQQLSSPGSWNLENLKRPATTAWTYLGSSPKAFFSIPTLLFYVLFEDDLQKGENMYSLGSELKY